MNAISQNIGSCPVHDNNKGCMEISNGIVIFVALPGAVDPRPRFPSWFVEGMHAVVVDYPVPPAEGLDVLPSPRTRYGI